MLDAFFGAPYDAMDDCPEPDPAAPPATLDPGLAVSAPQGPHGSVRVARDARPCYAGCCETVRPLCETVMPSPTP
jgi:hypothetical protein